MVQVVMNGVGGHRQGIINGKPQAPPSGSSLSKSKNKASNGDGVVKTAGSGGKQEAAGPRKLTKNEKRRQKNKQKRAQAVEGALVERSMAESNGVAVASWPPPAKEEPDVQVCACVRVYVPQLGVLLVGAARVVVFRVSLDMIVENRSHLERTNE